MMFSSPLFAFLFLPLVILFHATLGKRRPALSVFLIGVCYHVLLCFSTPQLPIALLCLIVYTYLAERIVCRVRKTLVLCIACVLPFSALIAVRNIAYTGLYDFIYPVGLGILILCCVSYLVDCYRNEVGRERGLYPLCRYLLFFPTLVAGPVIRYRDFLRLTEESSIDCDLNAISDGAKLYMVGFIKRVAVGALLTDTFFDLIGLTSYTPNLLVALLAVSSLFFGVYFTFSGYADMGAGIATMMGIRYATYSPHPLWVATPARYAENTFGGFSDWFGDYVAVPLRLCFPKKPRLYQAVLQAVFWIFILLFVRTRWYMALAALPLFAVGYMLTNKKTGRSLSLPVGVRILTGVATFLMMGLYWTLALSENPSAFWEYLSGMNTSDSAYQISLVISAFSGIKHLVVVLMGVITILPNTRLFTHLRTRIPTKATSILTYLWMLCLLVLFLFTIVFFLPQYPQYHTVPFGTLFI
ncbi:MAG: hypothetical protein E7664_01010 [Ruminococcaceae bacterium]|nr:hypothetical protein [Oscillospiraceae bacterium]